MGTEKNPFEVVIMLEPFHRLNIKAGNFDVWRYYNVLGKISGLRGKLNGLMLRYFMYNCIELL